MTNDEWHRNKAAEAIELALVRLSADERRRAKAVEVLEDALDRLEDVVAMTDDVRMEFDMAVAYAIGVLKGEDAE